MTLALLAAPQAYSLPPQLLAKARALEHLRTALYFGGTAWTLFCLGLLLHFRVGAALSTRAGRLTDRRPQGPFSPRPALAGLLLAPVWLLILAAIGLPGALLAHRVSLRYGLSIEHWAAWWQDFALSQALTLVVGTLLLSLVFWLLRSSSRLWWAWLWLCLQPFIVLGVYLTPLLIDPLFNHFTPLAIQAPALVPRLQQAATLGGLSIPASRIFVEDASRRVTGINAYVTGIGSSKRIVVWDTTLHTVPPNEILAIYAHEQGHYVLGHIPKGIAFSALLTFVLFALLATLFRRAFARYGDRWHIPDPDSWAALPLLLLLSTLLSFLSAPAANAFARSQEHAADLYGQHLLRRLLHSAVQNAAQNAAQVERDDFNRLGRAWLEDPAPNRFVVWWTYTHPPLADRARDATQ